MKKENKKEGNKEKKTKKIVKNKIIKKDGKIQKFIEIINKKWLVKGTTTLVLVCGIFAIYIGISLLLKNIELPQIDTTENKRFSLSEETKERIKNVDKDITITLINYGKDSEREETIKKYKALNNKIKVENIANVTFRPDLMEKYSLTDAQYTLIIVACGDREDVLTEEDLLELDFDTFETADKTEQVITNAIIDVTTNQKPKVYFMNNHTEFAIDYFSSLIEKMENDANEVEEIDLFAKGAIPEDCNVLIIPTLSEDITVQEKEEIIKYINNGGELLILNGPVPEKVNFSNFQPILDLYGVSMMKGIIYEQSPDNIYYRNTRVNNRRCNTK